MATITYTPEFKHQDWIDNVDRVAAGGDNGFNARFHALEAEFRRLSEIIAKLGDATETVPKDGSVSLRKFKVQKLWDTQRTLQPDTPEGISIPGISVAYPRASLLIRAYSPDDGARFNWSEESRTSGSIIEQVVIFRNLTDKVINIDVRIDELLES